MAIQMRRGLKKDFDPAKMLPGEWAVAIDPETENQIVWMCFAAGIVKRMGTYEDFMVQIQEISGDIKEEYVEALEAIKAEVDAAAEAVAKDKDTVVTAKSNIENTYLPQIQRYITNASNSASAAEKAKEDAQKAQKAIENLSVETSTLPAGSSATVKKSVADTGVTLHFGIPRGEQGATGPQGAQGIEGPVGPEGPPGESGVTVPLAGLFTLSVDDNGDLWAYYADTETEPPLEYDEATGELYYNVPEA